MSDDTQQRRVKVTDTSAVHRVGTKRAAVKPHKRTTEPNPKQIIADFLASLRSGSLKNTFTGDTLVKNAALLRKSFALAGNDDLYLLLDPSASGKAGLLLSSSGLSVADGRGGTGFVGWKDLPKCEISFENGMLVIGQTGITTKDAQHISTLLNKLKTAFAQ